MNTRYFYLTVCLALILIAGWSCKKANDLSAVKLTANNKEQPVGIDSNTLLLGWQIESQGNNILQTAYHILVAESGEDLKNETRLVWDSGIIMSAQSINIEYGGANLKPDTRYFWKVKIWDNMNRESGWSRVNWWHTGLFSEADWQGAQWISYEKMDTSLVLVPGIHGSGNHLEEKALQRSIVPQFRNSFQIEKEVKSATLSISGLGHYEAYLNGEKAGDSFLAPGWTDYNKTVLYNTYDVTSLINNGENVLGAIVGNGFYYINRERYRKLVIAYGFPKLKARLKIQFTDGSSTVVVTDESWKTTPSPITYSSIFGGEDYDATHVQKGWEKPGFDDSAWSSALITSDPDGRLVAENDYPLKELDRITPVKIVSLGDTAWLYDFGQNASGILELTVKGKAAQVVNLWPGELINDDNSINQRASGGPFYFSYTLNGDGIENWKPKFTYYGFRFVQVSGAVPKGENNRAGLPEIEQLTLIHTRNSSPENGTFTCSNDLLNRIHTLIDWAIRSNYQSVVTDCPHREKLGWLEQTHLMGQGIHFRYENYHLYRTLIFDMMDSQTEDGLIPDIAPEYVEFLDGFRDSPEWGSAAVILPWMLWKWYGDKQILEDAWLMMNRYVEYLRGKSDNHILSHGLGDWFDLGPRQPGVSQLTPISLTATATYFYDVKILAEIASLLEKPEKKNLQEWAGEIRNAFNSEFFDPETRVYSTGSQTAMSMPWCMGIAEDQHKEAVFANLVDTIITGNKALTAGDVGFHYLVEALTRGGATQLMYDMINRDDVPGYGYQLKKGATALTESWAALENVSNNHLMLGHVMEWFYAGLGGIGQTENSIAYKELHIEPQVDVDLSFVKTSFKTPYGLVRSEWEKTGQNIQFEIEIPHNSSAILVLPGGNIESIRINGKSPGTEIISETGEGDKIQLKLGSGVYKLTVD